MTAQDVPNSESNIDPDTGFNRLMVEQMAKSIQIAHDINPKSWCIDSWQDNNNRLHPIPAVGSVNIMSIGPGTPHGFMVDISESDIDQQQFIKELLDPTRQYKHYPWATYLLIPGDRVGEVLARLSSEHESSVRRVASHVKITNRWKRHNLQFVAQIESLLGYELPKPAYLPNLLPSSPETKPTHRFWKISPGSSGVEWPTFRDRGLIAIQWSDKILDLSQLPDNESQFKNQVRAALDVSHAGAQSLWQFAKVMKPGDKVLTYSSRTVLGHGEITSAYQSVADEYIFSHRRNVRWDSVATRRLDGLPPELLAKLSRNATLIELTSSEFHQATGTTQDHPQHVDFQPTQIRAALAATGLHYTHDQIATFYTALQTKGFVVLSGISGTGKSKIAQGFVDLLPSGPNSTSTQSSRDEGVITFTLKPYTKKSKNVILPSAQTYILPEMDMNDPQKIDIHFGDLSSRGTITKDLHQSDRVLFRLYFTGDVGRAIQELPLNQPIFLSPVIDEDEARLTGFTISLEPQVSPDSMIVPHAGQLTSNHLFLSVRPDWRDSTSLLGYFNPLTGAYEWTDFLRFIIRAGENYRTDNPIAWFVILDELNLAHVEYYFADLLSVIESGRHDGGDMDGFTREPLRLTYPESPGDDDMPPREIFLPPNLYIIGTVNMDETTHAFSPKVLDRAFTIELTDVDFSNYPPEMAEDADDIPDAAKHALLDAFTRNGQFARVSKTDILDIVQTHPVIRTRLQNLNALLQRDRFHFGYRVFDEIAQYLANSERNNLLPFDQAFDHAVFMKVMPKFSGSRARLRSPLLSVLAWAINPDLPDVTRITGDFDKSMTELDPNTYSKATCRRVAERAYQMLAALETDGFVSFG